MNIANNGLLDEHSNNLSYTVRLTVPDEDNNPLEHDPDNVPEEGYVATVRGVANLLGEMRAPSDREIMCAFRIVLSA